ncbi:MAG: hypothetical protein WBI04_00050 [Trichlorobacter sp.]
MDESIEHGGGAGVGQFCTPIIPLDGSFLHADSQQFEGAGIKIYCFLNSPRMFLVMLQPDLSDFKKQKGLAVMANPF